MAMNFAPIVTTSSMKLETKQPEMGMSFEDSPTPASPSSSTSSILGLAGRISGHNFLNGGGNAITCRICGKNEFNVGEFETIKLGDLFPNMSSSALSSPVAATTVAVGMCTECSKTQRSHVNPIFQAAAVIRSENRHRQQQTSTLKSWNNTGSSLNNNNNHHHHDSFPPQPQTPTHQYSPKGKSNYKTSPEMRTTTTPPSSSATGLPISVLRGNNSFKASKKNSVAGRNSSNASHPPLLPTDNKPVPIPIPPEALNSLNLLASASVLSFQGLVMGKKSSPTSISTTAITTTTPPVPKKKGGGGGNNGGGRKKKQLSKECPTCHKTFKSGKIAEQHFQRVHNHVENYRCDICGAVFSYRGSLESHLASHKPPLVTHDCPTCGQKFKVKSNLTTHLKLHSDTPKKFKCDFCESGFSKRVNLKTHIQRKHPEQAMNPPNTQMPPGQLYNNNGMGGIGYPSGPSTVNLLAVKPTKDTEKPEGNFNCEHCGRNFLFKNNLKAHLRTHTRDRKYTCEICEKSFIYKESLKNHMLLHSNEVPYQCDICLKRFRDRSNRRKHVKNVHKYMFVNGDVSSLAPIGSRSDVATEAGPSSSTAGFAPPPAKKTRRRNNKVTNEGNGSATTTTTAKAPKRNRKPAKSSSTLATANNTVIVSNASCSDQDRKIIMSPGPKMNQSQQQQQQHHQSVEYSLHGGNLGMVQVPSSSNPLYNRNVIVKASGALTPTSVPLPSFSDPYSRDCGSNPPPMQQNVIVYPKPKHSHLESYVQAELAESQHLTQYYTTPSTQGQTGIPIGIAYAEPIPTTYSSLLVHSPRSTTPNQQQNAFDSYAIANRRSSSGSGASKSPPGNCVVVTHSQYSSPAPIFTTPGPLRAEPYFWPAADNVGQTVVSHGHGSPYYNSPQNNSTPTPIMDPTDGNVLSSSPYSQTSEIIVGLGDPSLPANNNIPAIQQNTATSTNPNSFYYKDFDFSYL